MPRPHRVSRQLEREVATSALEHAAHQFAGVADRAARGGVSQELLQTRRYALYAAAVAYCAAHSHPSPDSP
jgi:hypothetical protein